MFQPFILATMIKKKVKPTRSPRPKIKLPPNTQGNMKGLKCLDGYLPNKDISVDGCFKCDYECKSFETCVSPGKCVEYPLKIVNISLGEKVFVMTDAKPAMSTAGFCKFGDEVVSAEIQNSTFICQRPPTLPEEYEVSVSFSGGLWSDSFKATEPRQSKFVLIITISCILVLATFFIIWKIIGRKYTKHPQFFPERGHQMAVFPIIRDENL